MSPSRYRPTYLDTLGHWQEGGSVTPPMEQLAHVHQRRREPGDHDLRHNARLILGKCFVVFAFTVRWHRLGMCSNV